MERERFVEIFAGLALIVFLILLIFLVMGVSVSGYGYKSSGASVTNSYNTNSYNKNSFNTYPSQTLPTAYTTTARTTKTAQYVAPSTSYPSSRTYTYTKPHIVDNRDSYSYDSYYSVRDKKYDYTKYRDYQLRYGYEPRYLGYDDFGNFRAYPGIVGNRVDSYEVYVRNREYVGGYFKTIFYFEDYYGNVDSESMTYYIPAGEEKRFSLKDVSPPRYKYGAWWYKVESLTKIPENVDYDYNYNRPSYSYSY